MCVGELKDLDLVCEIYAALDLNQRILPYRNILDYVRKHPDLMAIIDTCINNATVSAKKGASPKA